jgi:hypothetical protein
MRLVAILAIILLLAWQVHYLLKLGADRRAEIATREIAQFARPVAKLSPSTLASGHPSAQPRRAPYPAGAASIAGYIEGRPESPWMLLLKRCPDNLAGKLRDKDREPYWWQETEEDGSFHFRDLPAGRYLLAGTRDHDGISQLISLKEVDASVDQTLRSVKRQRVTGSVTDAGGNGQPDVLVYPLPAAGEDWRTFPQTWFPARTDDAGTFFFENLTPSVRRFLAVPAVGAPQMTDRLPGESEVLITFRDAGSLVGVVHTADGKALANEQVTVTEVVDGLEVYSTRVLTAGRFEIPALRAGRYAVQLRSDKWTLPEGRVLVDVPASGEHILTAGRAGQVRGRVVDRSTGKPVTDIKVIAVREGGQKPAYTDQTDQGGYYLIRGLPMGAYRISLETDAPYILVDDANDTVLIEKPTIEPGPNFSVEAP